MEYAEVLDRRAACAGGLAHGHKLANAALKSFRFLCTNSVQQSSDEEGCCLDITEFETMSVMPWEYIDDKGPSGQWKGETVPWSWKEYIASLDRLTYEAIFGLEGITRFVCRACPFPSPCPGVNGGLHWEFTATKQNGEQVGMHPPGRKGKLCWTLASDDERAAALAAVRRKGISDKVRACYPDTMGPRVNPTAATHTTLVKVNPSLLRGGLSSMAIPGGGQPSLLDNFFAAMQRVAVEGVPPIVNAPTPAAAMAPASSAAAASASTPAAALAVAQAPGAQQMPAQVVAPATQQTPARPPRPPATPQRHQTPAQDPVAALHPSFWITGPRTATWSGYEIELWNNDVYSSWGGQWWKLRGPDPRYNEFDSSMHRWSRYHEFD